MNPTFPYLESFKNPTAAGLIIGSNPNSADLTSGKGDPTGAGYLRLTNNQAGQIGYVYNTKDFPSEKGISVSFDYYGHGGSGSDGINFFLYDAAANPFNIGGTGGAMGYAQSYSSNGLSKGFIGLSIDEYGNFSSPGTGRQGGPGRSSGSVTLRGDGDGSTLIPSNYEYLTHIQTNNAGSMSAVGAGSPFQLFGSANGRSSGAAGLDSLKAGFRRIKMDLVPNGAGSGYVLNVWIAEGNPSGAIIHHLIKDFQYLPTNQIPANFRFGFWASSGGASTTYEIRNLEILLPSNLDHKPVLNKLIKSANEDQVLSFNLSDFTNSFFDPKGPNTLKNVEFTSLPPSNEGILKLDGTAVNSSQLIAISDISAGKLTFTPPLNYSGSVSSFKWNGHTATNKALADEDVIITVNSVNDAPAGTDREVTLKVNDSGYIFNEADFGFSDPNDSILNTFLGVKIVDLPGSGSLKLNNVAISAGQLIAIEALRGGQLKFVPGLNETGNPYTSFSFQVKDNGGQDNGGLDIDQSANVFKFNVSPVPSIQLTQANPVICIGTASAEIKFNNVTGDPLPNRYSINWDNSANTAGFIDVSNKDLTGTITIDGISGFAAGIYRGLLTVNSSNNSFESNEIPISLSIKPLLNAAISYGTDSFCAKGKANVSLTGDLGGKFSSSPGLNINESSGEINLSESTPGNYTIIYSLTNGVCSVTANASVSINAIPLISGINGASTISAGSTSQLSSDTPGGFWSSSNTAIASVNSTGLVHALKMGSAQIVYKVKVGTCTDSVSMQINVSQMRAGEMLKIMNENKSLSFSSAEFYDLIDSITKANDPSKSVMARIRIESLPANGILKLKESRVNTAQEILFNDISDLVYYPETNFSGTDSFRWNWSDLSGRYALNDTKLSVSVIAKNVVNQRSINENEIYKGQAFAKGRVSFILEGMDSSAISINPVSGELVMNARDFEHPADKDSDNNYDFVVSSRDARGNSYSENWRIEILNVKEYSKLGFEQVSDVEIFEKSKYSGTMPKLNGTAIGTISYTLVGRDSTLFKLYALTGIVSMEAKDFSSALDSDKDNVYEIGLKATDSDQNTAFVFWKVKIAKSQEVEAFTILPVENVIIDEKQSYTGLAPVLSGKPVGKVLYSLTGIDSALFKLDALTGIVSMEAKDFSSALDSDKDNVYEIGLKATDTNQNTASVFWKVKIVKIQEFETFSMLPIENVMIDEKMNYTGPAPVLIGKAVGKVLYSLSGKDSNLLTINELNGIVSMQGRDFDFPMDHDKNNVYEIGVVAKDSIGTRAFSEWKLIIRMIRPSAMQSMLTPEIMSKPISADASQLLTIVTKYPNGERYMKGGEQVLFSKLSGTATIGQITDLENGTYTALVYPGAKPGRSVFIATLGGREIMNGSGVVTQAIVDFGVSNDTRLKALSLSSGNLLPQFKTEVSDYSAYVEYSADSIAVIPALNDPNAIVEINGFKLPKSGSQNIPLLVGKNLISVIVTAADGLSKQRYNININRAEAVFPYQESFMSNIAEGLVLGANPNQAKLTSGTLDISGMGYLRLTNNKPKESGFVHNSKKIPTAKGLTISFEYYSHGGGSGEGLSFFLFDARANFKIGAFNGSLGYAQNLAQAGLNKGFLGLALDEYGEFSSSSSNKQGGPGRRPGSIVLRGDGHGENNFKDNYEYLTGIQTTDETAMKLAGAGSKFQIFGNQDGRTAPGGALDQDEAAYRKLKIQLVPDNTHTGFIINVWITEGANGAGMVHHVVKNYSYKPTDGIPVDLKYGFAASSGVSSKSYEIRNLEIRIPEVSQTVPEIPDLNPIDDSIKISATNLISLNGDGINDLWIVRNIEDFGNNSVKIFNRFGQEVYRKVNYTNDWDGKRGGNPLPTGTYYYVFEHSKSKIPVKGYITILQSN